MSYVVVLQPSETIEIETEKAVALQDILDGLHAKVPDGFVLTHFTASTARGVARRVGSREITGDDKQALLAGIPEGWRAVSIREE
ncbi:hypothetical protein [Microbacterium indicum]|uniref:hypothetical protein n=1 Tax=Microbacterium indicum TaxID=358100 RepID=UPI0004916562|nr:hypothetical protein [Microbacterium indicum]